jgi:ATP-dependent Clp protease ATP-binding subunit ClpC
MNDLTLRNLKIVVERAVRPVRATTARKRRMREEFLAHLTAIFDEECERLGDKQAALDEARRRFGDPGELSDQIQQTVPRWDRFGAILESMDFQPGESLLHLVGKQSLGMLAGYAVLTLLVGLPSLIVRGREAELPVMLRIVSIVTLFSIAATVLFLYLPHRMGRFLYGSGCERSPPKAAWSSVASLAILPALAFGTYWALTGDLASSLAHLRFACLFAPAAPVVLVMMARVAAEETRYKEEWASLKIDS